MRRVSTKSGYIAYRATAEETALLGGCGICDDCGKFSAEGYLIPVLNHYMCPDCFRDWESSSRFYPEDLPVEHGAAAYFESRIPLEGDESA